MFSIQNSIFQTRKLKLPEIPEVADGFFLQSEKQRTLQNHIYLVDKKTTVFDKVYIFQSESSLN